MISSSVVQYNEVDIDIPREVPLLGHQTNHKHLRNILSSVSATNIQILYSYYYIDLQQLWYDKQEDEQVAVTKNTC